MQHLNRLILATVCISLIYLSGCIEPKKGDKGDPAPIQTGNLVGSIQQVEAGPRNYNLRVEHHNPLINNTGGVLVTLENTNYGAVTNSKGEFTITGINTGTYTLSASKNGYGSIKIFNIAILPNTNNRLYNYNNYPIRFIQIAKKSIIEASQILYTNANGLLDFSSVGKGRKLYLKQKNFFKHGISSHDSTKLPMPIYGEGGIALFFSSSKM